MQNIEEKLNRYRDFWDNKPVKRPLVGYDVSGWFPFQRFTDLKNIEDKAYIEPSQLSAERCLPDYEAFMDRSWEVPDDYIKGVSPISAVPWMEAMLGCRIKRNGESVWAEERKASWDDLKRLDIPNDNPWLRTYIDFVRTLSSKSAGRYPVGVPILRGVADVMGAMRGHSESIIDLMEEPEESRRLARRAAEALIRVTKAHHKAAGEFHGGYYIEQYSLWAPGPLVRMQEDATAVLSPSLYRDIIQDCDRQIARAFPYSLIHLHSSSLFLIREFLDIKEIGVFQINRDVGEMGLTEMLPYLKTIQEEGRRIFLRGPLSTDDFAFIQKNLAPTGLMVQSVVSTIEEARELTKAASAIFG